jgi:hypothetical protein
MKIVLIHGIGHQGSTWHYADLICRELEKRGPIDITTFTLPRDMPHFCTGCYSCLLFMDEPSAGSYHVQEGRISGFYHGWQDVSLENKAKIQQQAESVAKKIHKSVHHLDHLRNPLFRSIFFRMMVGMEKKNDWNPRDRNHWEEKGWLNGSKPF